MEGTTSAQSPDPHWAPILCHLVPGVRVGVVYHHQVADRDISYNFDFLNSLPYEWGPGPSGSGFGVPH